MLNIFMTLNSFHLEVFQELLVYNIFNHYILLCYFSLVISQLKALQRNTLIMH